MGSPETAAMSELSAAAPEFAASLGFGKRAEGQLSTHRLWASAVGGCSALLGAGLAPGSPNTMGPPPFPCRRSQERVSVHPHRLHPSFDFGHQLQTPQPRYLAEGTDW